jgi:hypothetical protein
MYATCLFCAASLGTNEAIETFAVGNRVAFDAWRGRLWAVCPRCGRWNLAPIEERWEAVEAAERLFTDTRSRVQSENIGLCRLRDGTRLVRVGRALPGELAAWRYGSQLISRRRRNLAVGAAGVAAGGAVLAGLPLLISAGVTLPVLNLGLQAYAIRKSQAQLRRVVHRIEADRSPTGEELVVRRQHLHESVLTTTAAGDVGIRLPTPRLLHPWKIPASGWTPPASEPLEIGGDEARRILARSMTDYNSRGAKQQDVEQALALITEAGGPDEFARAIASSGAAITRTNTLYARHRAKSNTPSLKQVLGTFRGEILPVQKYRDPFNRDERPKLDNLHALALEMALNEESERRALEGELAALEAAWREAEEIAHIADALPGEPKPAGRRLSSRKRS